MRIPNICLVLKLDNGKVVSIADEKTHGQTDRLTKPPSTVLVYICSLDYHRFHVLFLSFLFEFIVFSFVVTCIH